MLIGAGRRRLWAAIPGILKVTRGVNEVISTIMLNYIATGLTAWLLGNYFRYRTSDTDLVSATKAMPVSARIPHLDRIVELFGINMPNAVNLQGFLVVAILVGIGYYVLLFRNPRSATTYAPPGSIRWPPAAPASTRSGWC